MDKEFINKIEKITNEKYDVGLHLFKYVKKIENMSGHCICGHSIKLIHVIEYSGTHYNIGAGCIKKYFKNNKFYFDMTKEENDIKKINKYMNKRINFGKHDGKFLKEIDLGYLIFLNENCKKFQTKGFSYVVQLMKDMINKREITR